MAAPLEPPRRRLGCRGRRSRNRQSPQAAAATRRDEDGRPKRGSSAATPASLPRAPHFRSRQKTNMAAGNAEGSRPVEGGGRKSAALWAAVSVVGAAALPFPVRRPRRGAQIEAFGRGLWGGPAGGRARARTREGRRLRAHSARARRLLKGEGRAGEAPVAAGGGGGAAGRQARLRRAVGRRLRSHRGGRARRGSAAGGSAGPVRGLGQVRDPLSHLPVGVGAPPPASSHKLLRQPCQVGRPARGGVRCPRPPAANPGGALSAEEACRVSPPPRAASPPCLEEGAWAWGGSPVRPPCSARCGGAARAHLVPPAEGGGPRACPQKPVAGSGGTLWRRFSARGQGGSRRVAAALLIRGKENNSGGKETLLPFWSIKRSLFSPPPSGAC